jgi:CheY-like chemotaxis protein
MACTLTRVESRGELAAALEAGGFDLILSDNAVPSYDGLSALARAREHRPEVPFIYASGNRGRSTSLRRAPNRPQDIPSSARPTRPTCTWRRTRG